MTSSALVTSSNTDRTAEVSRNTAETRITVRINLDGTGQSQLSTGIGFFDHMLEQIARHGLIDLEVQADGDLHIDGHHPVEDVGITLGQAVARAIGDKKGLRRYGHAYVPLDEALTRVVIDLSGRPGLTLNIPIFSNRKNRTAVNKAKIALNDSYLEWTSLQKELLRNVESAYLDAVSAQAQYLSAREKEKYARESYELTSEQFRVGVKNTVELITAQNEYSAAQQQVLQAKYLTLLSIELLNIYQGLPASDIY